MPSLHAANPTTKETEILHGDWLDPYAGLIPLGQYATAWIDERGLRPKTIQLYRYLLRRHLMPGLGAKAIADIHEAQVRRWRKHLLDAGVSEVTTAKAYRLLKAIMNTASDDGLIRRNPCRIKGAATETSPERPVLTVTQVYDIADTIQPFYRALILLATFASLRWGELAALRRCDIDLTTRIVRVRRQLTETTGHGLAFGPPKSAAGVRIVALPGLILADMADHLAAFTGNGTDALVFTSPQGTPLRHGNFQRRAWLPALNRAGLSGIHLHDLRGTGNTYTANAGANPRELMTRMGHSSTRAAMIYLHSSDPRQRAIADAVDKAARAELRRAHRRTRRPASKASGTEVARGRDQSK